MDQTAETLRRSNEGTTSSWHDERGHLTFITMIGDDTTPTDQLASGRCVLPPSGFLADHAHDAAEIYFVLQGTAIATVGRRKEVLRRGDMLFIPSGARHSLRNDASEAFEFMFTYAAHSLSDPRTSYR